MKNTKSNLFVVICMVATLSSLAWATDLQFGQTQSGTIGSAGQSNSYTFSANANDVVDFTMVATSGTLSPKIQLYNPSGTLIASANPFNCSGATIELNTVTLAVAGTYTVVLSDCSTKNTGNYDIYLQRTNNPSGAANLPFGQTQTGTITAAAASSTYTFTANANDVVDFTIAASGISPKIRVYGPTGALVGSANDFNCSGSTVELNTVTLPASGAYTVLVGDCSDTLTGSYSIYSQRTNNPSGAVNLPFGQTLSGTITAPADSSTYTFTANANDVVDFTIAATGISPKIRLYGPTGALVSSANDFNCSGSTVEMNTVTLTQSGVYTVLVGDCADTNTGSFEIYSQRTENPSGGSLLPFGQTQSGTISAEAQSNSYTFSANAGDVVDFTMTATGLSPKIRLYGPTGALVGSANDFNCSGSTVELNTVTLAASGTYTVLVGDCSDTHTGSYSLYGQRTNNPSGAAMVLLSQTQTGNIASAAQSTSYVFGANTNDVVDFTLSATGFSPKIRLYGPTGALVGSNNDFNCSGSTVELNTVKLPASGSYAVLVGDCSDTLTGSYSFYAQRTNNPFAPVPMIWGGGTQAGNIMSAAYSGTYTFSGAASNVVDLTMVTTSGSLSPKIRLYNPDGTLLSSANDFNCSGSSVQMNSVTLAQNGIYTILVGDCSDTLTGNYNLSGLCFGTCPTMPAITWPAPAPINYPTPLSATQLDATSPVAGTFVYNPVSGTVLPPGPQSLSVTFTPTDTSTYSTAVDSVQLMVNSPAGATVSPTSLKFGNQAIDETSVPKSVTLTNIGTATLTISSITVSANFAVSSTTCKATLGVGKKCKVSVTFMPTALGPVTGTLSITDNAPNSPQMVALSGTGIVPAAITPTHGTFPATKVGTTSAAKNFTLTNNQPITLSSIVIATTGDFALSATTCTSTLAAKKKCTISVTFTPTQTGKRTGQLSVTDSASNSPQTASLTGTGK